MQTESDVEQKFIYPLLTTSSPLGLSINDALIQTKPTLRMKLIGKGTSQKYYHPDYLIVIRGLPVLVVEAKRPGTDLAIAYSEARLYAAEVNAKFAHNVNVCQLVFVCNGEETWAGYYDHEEPEVKLTFNDFSVENINYVNLLDLCSIRNLEELSSRPYINARGEARFYTPVSQLGGKRVQNEELEENSFGRTFVFENRNIFDPETEEERSIIVENAYVPSAKREQHIEPLYKEIRKYELPSKESATPLATDDPIELMRKMSQRIDDKIEAYSLMLVIGNVGSGKSTFIRYFKRMFLEKKHSTLAARCEWIFLNMNFAPDASSEIYDWIKKRMLEQIQKNHNDIDFSTLDIIKRVFRKDINEFEKGLGQLLIKDDAKYKEHLFNLLNKNMEDTTKLLESQLIFLKENNGLLPIVVLDNCDKRDKDVQLLMFQVAQWIRNTFKCIVILPMRDSTYDSYRNEPPLDTVVKDLVFRIDPPDLFKVIQARLNYIMRITNPTQTTYMLENGVQVSIERSRLVEYFKHIIIAIRNNQLASSVIYKLSDRNTRNGIQIFEDFCKSGHISTNDIFKIRVSDHHYKLPSHIFINALLRKNRKYYNGEESNFINLFHSKFSDDFPDPFVRIDILRWLATKNNKISERIKGMFMSSLLLKEMQLIGHNIDVVHRELNYLVKNGLVFSDASSYVSESDYIKIALPGFMHLTMLVNINYLAACAEDVLFKDTNVMARLTRRLKGSYLSKIAVILTADNLITYLCEYRTEFFSRPEIYMEDTNTLEIYNMHECREAINKAITEDKYIKDAFEHIQLYKSGTQVSAAVIEKTKHALFCIFTDDNSIKGYITVVDPQYKLDYSTLAEIQVNDQLKCEVIEYDCAHGNFQLKFISRC